MLKASITEVRCVIEVLKAPFLKFCPWMPFAIAFWTEEKIVVGL
jgi:hypothetical protein